MGTTFDSIGATQSQILSDGTPFAGADIASIKAVTDLLPDAGALTTIDTNIDGIKTTTDALPSLTETGGTHTTDGTEQDLWIANAPSGVWEPRCITIDTTNQTAGETIVVREYRRDALAGGWILYDNETYAGVVSPVGITWGLEPNRYGVKITIEKTGGTNRAYVWEAFYKAV